MTQFRFLVPLCLSGFLAACEISPPPVSTPVAPRLAVYNCSEEVTLQVRRIGSSVSVTDSRGIDITMPASPAGQTTRYAEGIHALILEGRNATWFVSGKVPVECRR